MGFSLKPAAESVRTAHAAAMAGSIAASQSGGADAAGLFADLFAGQFFAAGQTDAANDALASATITALPTAKPQAKDAAESVVEDAVVAAQPDAALLAQMQAAVLQPPPTEKPSPLARAVVPDTAEGLSAPQEGARQTDDTASQVMALGQSAQTTAQLAQAQVTAQLASPAIAPQLPLPVTPSPEPLAATAAAPVLTAEPLLAAQVQSLTVPAAGARTLAPTGSERSANGSSQAVAAAAASPFSLASPLSAMQAVQQAASSGSSNQSGAERGTDNPFVPAADTLTAKRPRNDILPADVRLLFRRDAADATADAAATVDTATVGQRQILPLTMPSAPVMQPASGNDWRIDQPMANTAPWREAFGEKVGSMVTMNIDTASIQVSPEQLGPLDISIRFDQQDRAMISVVAANPEAKGIVEASLPQLAKMLEQGGIQLGSTQVSTQQQASQQAQQQAQEQARQQSGQQGRQRDASPALPEEALAERDIAVSTLRQQGLNIQA